LACDGLGSQKPNTARHYATPGSIGMYLCKKIGYPRNEDHMCNEHPEGTHGVAKEVVVSKV